MDAPISRLTIIQNLSTQWKTGDLSYAVYATLYFLYWQIHLHGRRFASRKSKKDLKPNPEIWLNDMVRLTGDDLTRLLIDYVERFHFLGIIPNVSRSLLAWLRNEWSLTLTESIPSPLEVLEMQAMGTRPITLIAHYPRMLQPVLKKSNGFEFIVHDLEHAFKFFYDPVQHEAQRKFFSLMQKAWRQNLFISYRSDPIFSEQFDYVISDMNTHVIHSLRFLTSALIESLLRRERKLPHEMLSLETESELSQLMQSLSECWGFTGSTKKAMQNLMSGRFSEDDAEAIERGIGYTEYFHSPLFH